MAHQNAVYKITLHAFPIGNLHGFCEEARNLLAALIVSSTDAALVKLLAGAEFTITACLATFALNTDS